MTSAFLCALFVPALLGACTKQPGWVPFGGGNGDAWPVTSSWKCRDGTALDLHFDQDAGNAHVIVDDRNAVVLAPARSPQSWSDGRHYLQAGDGPDEPVRFARGRRAATECRMR